MSYSLSVDNFKYELSRVVGHLSEARQLNNELSDQVARLVQKFMYGHDLQAICSITRFDMLVITASVKKSFLPFDVIGCMNGKSVNRIALARAYGEEVSDKELYCRMEIERRR